MSDKIELMKLCGVLQSKFSRLSQSESRTQPCHVRMSVALEASVNHSISKYFYYMNFVVIELIANFFDIFKVLI